MFESRHGCNPIRAGNYALSLIIIPATRFRKNAAAFFPTDGVLLDVSKRPECFLRAQGSTRLCMRRTTPRAAASASSMAKAQ